MRPEDDQERGVAARLSARLQTLIGAGRDVSDFEVLAADTTRLLGPAHEVTLGVEYALESRRDAGRTPAESLPVWSELLGRATASLPPSDAAAVAIRSRHRHQLRGRGRPGDLDTLVELCRREIERTGAGPGDRRLGDARADLAWVLRDRAWFAAFQPARPRPAPRDDLAEALDLIGDEVRRRSGGAAPDRPSADVARRIQAEVLLAAGRDDPGAAARALELAEELAKLEDTDDDHRRPATGFDQLPRARVLLAEGLLLTGQTDQATRVARLAYALHGTPPVFDPARPLLVLARTADRPQAVATAQTALAQRRSTFPPDSHFVAEAHRLVQELAS
ncbi:hypothetical protein [Actinoplanes sp. NPDC049265]|uniref:hypothetical protein n=1 Tax=Actinoplanes sp. NPDC049265 TaxID=3363902 RepID=UPI0037147BE7